MIATTLKAAMVDASSTATALSALWRWTYPPIEDRVVSSPARLAITTLFFILAAHLLLRHHQNATCNACRRYVLLPATCIVSIHAIFGFVLPDARYEPGPPGSIPWASRPHGNEVTFSRSQAEMNAFGSLIGLFLLKVVDLCLAKVPPSLAKERLELQALLDAKAGQQKKGSGSRDVARSTTTGIDAGQPTRAEFDNESTGSNGSVLPAPSQRLPWFVPGTKIPLEVDLAISMRYYGWSTGRPYSPGTKPVDTLPPPQSPAFDSLQAHRKRLIVSGLKMAVLGYAVADVVDSILKSPGLWGERANLGTPLRLGGIEGQGLHWEDYSLGQRMALALVVGATAPVAIQAVYSVTVAMAMLPPFLFPTSSLLAKYTYADPSHWEPVMLFGPLWNPQSVRHIWARHWHQQFSPTFRNVIFRPIEDAFTRLGCGVDARSSRAGQQPENSSAPPTKREKSSATVVRVWRGAPGRAFVRALATLAVFLVSGLMHEAGVLGQARTQPERDPWRLLGLGTPLAIYQPGGKPREVLYYDRGGHLVVFFLMQGVGCILEDAVELLSARRVRVRGWAGSIWALSWFFGWGMVAAEPVLRRGLTQGWNSFRLTTLLVETLRRRFA